MAYDTGRDADDVARDMVIVFNSPRFDGMKPIDALAELKRIRRDQRREEHRQRLNPNHDT